MQAIINKDVLDPQHLSLKDKYFKKQLQENILKFWFNLSEIIS